MSNHSSILGLTEYASDSDHEDQPTQAPVAGPSRPKPSSVSSATSKKSTGLGLPPPKGSKRRDGPVKIVVDKLGPTPEEEQGEGEEPAAKRPRTDAGPPSTGSGKSGLLSMLPPPKKGAITSAAERAAVLKPKEKLTKMQEAVPTVNPDFVNPWELEYVPDPTLDLAVTGEAEPSKKEANASTLYREQWEKQSIADGVGLGDAWMNRRFVVADTPAARELAEKQAVAADSKPAFFPAVIAAPELESWENWVPPEPKRDDPYPGFYKHPSGSWEQHEYDYYMQFYNRWVGYDEGTEPFAPAPTEKGFEAYRAEYGVEANARKVWQGAENERLKRNAEREAKKLAEEERKKAEEEGRAEPQPQLTAAKATKTAKARHQLASELYNVMSNREAMEERIQESRRNRKESGVKYGF